MVTAAACLWGSFSIFLRNAEAIVADAGGSLSAATESFIFFAVVLIVLGPRALRASPAARPPRAAYAWLAFFSVADALNLLCYFAAMQKTTVAVAVLTHYLSPVFVAVLAPLIIFERLPRGIFVACVGAIFGLALLVEPLQLLEQISQDSANSLQSGTVLGPLLGLSSAVLFSSVVISMKRLGAWFSSEQILVFHYPLALLLLYLFIPQGEFNMPWQAWLLLIGAGLVPGTVGGWLFVEGVRSIAASRAGILTLIEPVVAVTLGVLLWHEHPSWIAWFGAVVILASAYRVISAGESPSDSERA